MKSRLEWVYKLEQVLELIFEAIDITRPLYGALKSSFDPGIVTISVSSHQDIMVSQTL